MKNRNVFAGAMALTCTFGVIAPSATFAGNTANTVITGGAWYAGSAIGARFCGYGCGAALGTGSKLGVQYLLTHPLTSCKGGGSSGIANSTAQHC